MISLNETQKKQYFAFREFINKEIAPINDLFSHQSQLEPFFLEKLKSSKILGSLMPEKYFGAEIDFILYGLLCKELGKVSAALRALLTVHDMVCFAIHSFGSDAIKDHWLPQLTKGNSIAAYALSEDCSGSDINQIETTLETSRDEYILNGSKKWISYADIANVFLVFAKINDQPVAVLVPANCQGISVKRMDNLVSEAWSTVNEINFENVKISKENLIGDIGSGFSLVANQTLTLGRYSIAWSNLGIMEGCFSACREFTNKRLIDGKPLSFFQLTQQKLSDMIVDIKSVQLLCLEAGCRLNKSIISSMPNVMLAKYKSSKSVVWATNECMQLQGARAFDNQSPFKKWLMEAKLSEIIEGSREIHQISISQLFGDNIESLC